MSDVGLLRAKSKVSPDTIIDENIYESKSRIIPVEEKSADNTQAKSYKQFCRKYSPQKGFKLSRKNIARNICENTPTISLPLYLAWNMDEYCE